MAMHCVRMVWGSIGIHVKIVPVHPPHAENGPGHQTHYFGFGVGGGWGGEFNTQHHYFFNFICFWWRGGGVNTHSCRFVVGGGGVQSGFLYVRVIACAVLCGDWLELCQHGYPQGNQRRALSALLRVRPLHIWRCAARHFFVLQFEL